MIPLIIAGALALVVLAAIGFGFKIISDQEKDVKANTHQADSLKDELAMKDREATKVVADRESLQEEMNAALADIDRLRKELGSKESLYYETQKKCDIMEQKLTESNEVQKELEQQKDEALSESLKYKKFEAQIKEKEAAIAAAEIAEKKLSDEKDKLSKELKDATKALEDEKNKVKKLEQEFTSNQESTANQAEQVEPQSPVVQEKQEEVIVDEAKETEPVKEEVKDEPISVDEPINISEKEEIQEEVKEETKEEVVEDKPLPVVEPQEEVVASPPDEPKDEEQPQEASKSKEEKEEVSPFERFLKPKIKPGQE